MQKYSENIVLAGTLKLVQNLSKITCQNRPDLKLVRNLSKNSNIDYVAHGVAQVASEVMRMSVLLLCMYREAEKTIGFWPSPAPKYNRGQKPKKHGGAKAEHRGQRRKNMAGPTPKKQSVIT